MVSEPSPELNAEAAARPRRPPLPIKIVVAGGFLAVGKTTTVASISEIFP